ncbi:hypothetical protein [Actinoplanes sp. NPDC048796]|uniref:hypothetical protein n=1 Tax=Actinoplanes sp. NPDC048796 TaxID=3155640 RepID=UPI0033E322DC
MSGTDLLRAGVLAAAAAGLLLTSACAADNAAAPGPTPSASGAAPASSPVDLTGDETALPNPTSAAPVPSSSTSARPTASSPAGGGVFSGTRQVLLLPKNSEATVGVVTGDKLGLTDSFGDKALFVIVPAGGDKYSIKTAKLRAGGEPLCVSAKVGSGGAPALIHLVGCDAAAASQKFRFRQTGESNGKPTYTIYTGADTFIVQDPTGEIAGLGTGVIAATIGEGTADIDTPFVLADKGKASLPALD